MKREIFCIDNPSCYLDEELVAMKLWNKNPYQHLLTSSHHFIICDERYPKKPVSIFSEFNNNFFKSRNAYFFS